MERFARVGSRSVWGSPGGLWRESGLAFPRNPRFSRLRSLLQMPHPRDVAAPCRAKEPTQRLLLLLWHRQPLCARRDPVIYEWNRKSCEERELWGRDQSCFVTEARLESGHSFFPSRVSVSDLVLQGFCSRFYSISFLPSPFIHSVIHSFVHVSGACRLPGAGLGALQESRYLFLTSLCCRVCYCFHSAGGEMEGRKHYDVFPNNWSRT